MHSSRVEQHEICPLQACWNMFENRIKVVGIQNVGAAQNSSVIQTYRS